MKSKMTVEQQKLVKANHNLIYWFLYKYKLNPDEYYDILALGLCKAAMSYSEGISKFSTYAITVMLNEVKNYNRTFIASSRIPTNVIVSYEESAITNAEGDTQSILDTLAAPNNTEDEVVTSIYLEDFMNDISDTDRYVLSKLSKGFTQAEIAKSLGVSRNAIFQRLQRLRSSLQEDL